MTNLTAKECVPCSLGVPSLDQAQQHALLAELDARWSVVDLHHLRRDYAFGDFAEALAFTKEVGALAEREGHHPDIYLAWGKVTVTIWTHKIDGLSEADFVLAAKIDRLG